MHRGKLAVVGALMVAALAVAGIAAAKTTAPGSASATRLSAAADCGLTGPIKHVVYLQFDNTHYLRDRPNVASDLEQMPHLLNFLKQNGTLFTNDHTILI